MNVCCNFENATLSDETLLELETIIGDTLIAMCPKSDDSVDIDVEFLPLDAKGYLTNCEDYFHMELNTDIIDDREELIKTVIHETVHISQHLRDAPLCEDEAYQKEEELFVQYI